MEEKVYFRTIDGLKLCGLFSAPKKITKKAVILCHGITVDKDEDGGFQPLAKKLNEIGYAVLRLDFRGHGESGGKFSKMTISGEILDIKSSVSFLKKKKYSQFAILGASFGAVSSIYSAKPKDIKCLILWYPVLDLIKTFLKPELPWAKKSFNEKGYKILKEKGYLLLDGYFKLGKDLIKEMSIFKPYKELSELKIPVLTIHGDKDTYVPYYIAKKYGKPNSKSKFLTMKGTEHGPTSISKSLNFLVDETISWVKKYLR